MSEAEVAAPVEAPAPAVIDEDADLSAAFDRAQGPESQPEPPDPEPPEPEKAPETAPEEAPEEATDGSDADIPANIPEPLKAALRGVPKDAREAVLQDRDGLHRKLSDMGRQVQGIAPIRDVLVAAVKEFPSLAGMRPEKAAEEIFALAKISQGFSAKPAETILGLIKKHGMEKEMAAALAGQPAPEGARENVELRQKVQLLERRLSQVSDPEYLREQVSQITSQERVFGDVNSFAAKAEHWGDVEEHMPMFVRVAKSKLGEGAAPAAVLESAYKMALNALKPEAMQAHDPQPVTDPLVAESPDKTKAALKAKSVNVLGKATGRPRVKTEDEELAEAFDRAHKA